MRFFAVFVYLLWVCLSFGETGSNAPKAQNAQVTVAVMPFFGTDLGEEDELIAVAMRDGVLQRLVNDTSIRIVIRRRAYALSLDAEILIDDPSAAKYRTPADYLVFSHLVPSETGNTSSFDIVAGIYESATGDLIFLEEIAGGSNDPEVLASNFCEPISRALKEKTTPLSYNDASSNAARPDRIVLLPVWVMGGGGYDFWEVANQLMTRSKSGLLAGWPSTSVVDAGEVIEIIEAHGLNRIGGRADAYAENLARVLDADQVLLMHLNTYLNKDSEEAWSLGLMAIDIETGLVTRANHNSFPSLDVLIQEAEKAAFELTQMEHDLPIVAQPQSVLRKRLEFEGKLYSVMAAEKGWLKKWLRDLDSALRVEMAEMALSTHPDLSDEEFIGLLDQAYRLTFGLPKEVDVYQNFHVSSVDDFVLNSAADFMHLALSSRNWERREMVYVGDCLRVQSLIRMSQPEEAISYLDRIPSDRPEYSYLLSQIRMLEGRYSDALNIFQTMQPEGAEYYELKAGAAYSIGEVETEYAALKQYMIKSGRLDHLEISQRMVYLMNDFESPENRIALIKKYLSRWGEATDVAQYTLARARLELGQESLALPVLHSLSKRMLTGILWTHRSAVKQELAVLLAPYEEAVVQVSYADVNTPPERSRYYIQPIGYSDEIALNAAIQRASAFAGFKFVLLPPIEPPLHDLIYDVEGRRFNAYALQQWLAGVYQIPEDAIHCVFLLDEELAWGRGWIYSNTQAHGWTVMSDFRWRKYFPRFSSEKISRGLAKVWLSVFQHPMKRLFGPQRVLEITGDPDWPNHAGTIQYSKGTAEEVFEATFSLCESTQKLYRAIDWDALEAFQQSELVKYRAQHKDAIVLLSKAVGPPVLSGE